jgi:hypothetical protein
MLSLTSSTRHLPCHRSGVNHYSNKLYYLLYTSTHHTLHAYGCDDAWFQCLSDGNISIKQRPNFLKCSYQRTNRPETKPVVDETRLLPRIYPLQAPSTYLPPSRGLAWFTSVPPEIFWNNKPNFKYAGITKNHVLLNLSWPSFHQTMNKTRKWHCLQ